MGDESDGSDKWVRVGIGGGRRRHVRTAVESRAGRGVDGEGAGNKLGSEGERMDGGTRGKGKVLCNENTWGELDDVMIGQVEVEEVGIKTQETSHVSTWYAGGRVDGGVKVVKFRAQPAHGQYIHFRGEKPEMTVPSRTSFFSSWLSAVWQRLCEVGRANEVLVVRGGIEIDGRPWYGLRWLVKVVGNAEMQSRWVRWKEPEEDMASRWAAAESGQAEAWVVKAVDGEDAGSKLGSKGEQAGRGARGEGKVICGENMWDELYGVTIGQVEVEEVGIRTQVRSLSRCDRGEVARQRSAGGHPQQVQEMTGWLRMGTVKGSIALVDRQDWGYLRGLHLPPSKMKTTCKVKWLFHWLIKALDLKEGGKMNTSHWGRIRSKIWHHSQISVSVSHALREGGLRVNYSQMIHLGEAVRWAHCYRVGRSSYTDRDNAQKAQPYVVSSTFLCRWVHGLLEIARDGELGGMGV
ncbi:hypothetical protein EDB89DRAFT_2242034 [Lactarius sanguifluus]|nr:hypothetical protein EDB89DRAFT_2242034 [Lactarius sanguifluus]